MPRHNAGRPGGNTHHVLRSDALVAGAANDEDVFSFYGRAVQRTGDVPTRTEFVAKLHHVKNNSAGVLVGGFLGSGHVKGQSAAKTTEMHLSRLYAPVHSTKTDKRWASRERGVTIDVILVCSSTLAADAARSAQHALQGSNQV